MKFVARLDQFAQFDLLGRRPERVFGGYVIIPFRSLLYLLLHAPYFLVQKHGFRIWLGLLQNVIIQTFINGLRIGIKGPPLDPVIQTPNGVIFLLDGFIFAIF